MNRRNFIKRSIVAVASLYGSAHLAREIFAEPETIEQEKLIPITNIYSFRNAVFSQNGKELFIQTTNGRMNRYKLSTAWDMSTSSYDPIFIA